jgi:hypothetical protein
MAQHFVPQFYLKSFTPNRSGKIYAYPRDSKPIPGTVRDFCCERGFHSFIDSSGQMNNTFDEMLKKLEGIWAPRFMRLQEEKNPDALTGEERADIAYFLAFQQTRNRRFREYIKNFHDASDKMVMRLHATNEQTLRMSFGEAGIELVDDEVKAMHDFILNDKYRVEYPEVFCLLLSMELALETFPVYLAKEHWQLGIVEHPNVLITSDNPVAILPPPNMSRFFGVGITNGVICLPLTPDLALILHDRDDLVEYSKSLSKFKVKMINDHLMFYANRYVFSDIYLPEIEQEFRQTKEGAGERVVLDGPPSVIPTEHRKPDIE